MEVAIKMISFLDLENFRLYAWVGGRAVTQMRIV